MENQNNNNNTTRQMILLDTGDTRDHILRYLRGLGIIPHILRQEQYLERVAGGDPTEYTPTIIALLTEGFRVKVEEKLEAYPEEFACIEPNVETLVKLLDLIEFFVRKDHIRCGVEEHYDICANIITAILSHYQGVITRDFDGLMERVEKQQEEEVNSSN